MTPQEKAKELFEKYFNMKWQTYDRRTTSIKSMTKSAAKQCALIAVDEIIKIDIRQSPYNINNEYEYWQQVKQELLK